MAAKVDNRKLMTAMFASVCEGWPDWATLSADFRDALPRRLERSCFNDTITECEVLGINRSFTVAAFCNRYAAKCMKVAANLAPDVVASTRLMSRIISGEVDVVNIAKMTSEQLCPEASLVERTDIKVRSEQKIARKISRMYTCKKCGKNETVYRDFQMARGDEDSTISIKCIHCGNVWRH